jgi:hypothetical protein
MHMHLLRMKATILPIQSPSKKARERCMQSQRRKGTPNPSMIPQFPKVEKEIKGRLLRFGYLGKWSPCAYESLSTKGETITLVLYFMILISP